MSKKYYKVTPKVTHKVKCTHVVFGSTHIYYRPCNVLKEMPDGRLKVEVFSLYHLTDGAGSYVRYVEAERVEEQEAI